MRIVKSGLLAVASLTVAASPAMVPPDLAAAVRAYDAAQVKGDRAALTRLLADDYLLANSGGKVQDKASFIADLTDPASRMDPFTVEQPIERVWTDGAVMGGVVHATGTDHDKRYAATIRFSDIWAKRGGRWQVVYTHASRLP